MKRASAEIGFDDPGIRHDRLRLAVRDDASGVHADQSFGDAQEDMHDVFDPDEGDSGSFELENNVDEPIRLGVRQAAADLVEQQDLRVGCESARKLEPLAVDEAEGFGAPVGDHRHFGALERGDRFVVGGVAVQSSAVTPPRRRRSRKRSCR